MTVERSRIPELPLEDEPIRDGIGEDDNPIPLWFNIGFYGLMIFGALYIVYYLLISDWSSASMYAAESAVVEERVAAARAAMPKENPYHGDSAAIAEGQEVFNSICAACHLQDGRGLVGPSLIDPYSKYGDSDEALFTTLAEGRPLGMPPWAAQLGTDKIWKVLAYMETLPKTSEPGVGAPGYEAPAGG